MDTNILQYISPEILQQRNAEFMAKYPNDDAQIDYYTDLALKLWEEFQIDGSYDVRGTRVNVQVWYYNKLSQMEMFRKHPYWCEEAKAIIFAFKEKRNVDFGAASNNMHALRAYLYSHTRACRGLEILGLIENALHTMYEDGDDGSTTINSRFIELLQRNLNYYGINLSTGAQRMLRPGTKISRFIRKCCEEFEDRNGNIINVMTCEDPHEPDDRTFDSAEKKFAKLADSLSELTTTKVGFMSLNFLDFMTMSNGNSWSTCHYINSNGLFHNADGSGSHYSGAYKQGCLSYALDEPSFIFYTLPDKTTVTDYYRVKKLTRMCCQYANGTLVTGKCYPSNATELISLYVSMLQEIISVTETSADSWDTDMDSGNVCTYVSTSSHAAHYADYSMSRQRPTISLCRRLMLPQEKQMTIGHRAYCVYCGTELNRGDSRWLQCSPHRKKMVCMQCGKKLTDDMTYHEWGEALVCDDCAFYCAVHECVELIGDLHGTIIMGGVEVKVCKNAIKNVIAQCENCGEYGMKSKMLKTVNGYSCKKHVRRYKKCALCGKYVPNKDVHVHDNGNTYCDKCNHTIECYVSVGIVQKDKYRVGDYVVMANEANIRNCTFGVCTEMYKYYPNRIVRITDVSTDWRGNTRYNTTSVPEDPFTEWSWCDNCIAGAVIGIDDRFLSMTIDEVRHLIKGE